MIFDACNIALMILMMFLFMYPLYFIIIASLSEPRAVATGQVSLWIVDFTLAPYRNVLRDTRIWTGYKNSIIYTLAGTIYNLIVMLPAAYVLSKKKLPGRSVIMWYFLITMYFSGGMIPTFLLHKRLGWLNTRWILIFSGGINVYNMVVTRTYFSTSIPEDVYEAARIDGASNFQAFIKIALPLATPIIAVMSLYYGVAHWNDWFKAFIYVQKPAFAPLQLVLRQILIDNQSMLSEAMLLGDEDMIVEAQKLIYMAEGMKYAVIFIASAPLLCAIPLYRSIS